MKKGGGDSRCLFMALRDNGFIAKSHISRRWKIQFTESPGWLCTQRQPVYAQEDMGACGKCIWRTTPNAALPARHAQGFGPQAKRKPREGWILTQTPEPRQDHQKVWDDLKVTHNSQACPRNCLSFWRQQTRWKTARTAQICGTFTTFMWLSEGKKKSALIDSLACRDPVLSKIFLCLFVCLFVRNLHGRTTIQGLSLIAIMQKKIYTSFQRHLPKEAKEVSGI